MSVGNLLAVQSGGPTAVLNTTLAAIIDESQKQNVPKIVGALHGMEGLTNNRLTNLTSLTKQELDLLANTPAAALGSSRYKPTNDDLARILANLKSHQIRHLLLIGGNGSLRGALAIHQAAERERYDLQVIGIPKTIDNDIPSTDRCPGYASAARYVAQSVRDLGMDVRALPQPVSIFETMGRSVGWLAAAAALAKLDEHSAPHLIYLPEKPFDIARFIADVDRIVTKVGHCIAVVPEGLKDHTGTPIHESSHDSQRDAMNRPLPGDIALHLASIITQSLKIRCRTEKPGLCARSSTLHISPQDRFDADLVGRAAVRAAVEGNQAVFISLRPLVADVPYDLLPLSRADGSDRAIPQSWLNNSDLSVSDDFLNYARPLVGPLINYAIPFHQTANPPSSP
jgi:6-phosphofructokinase